MGPCPDEEEKRAFAGNTDPEGSFHALRLIPTTRFDSFLPEIQTGPPRKTDRSRSSFGVYNQPGDEDSSKWIVSVKCTCDREEDDLTTGVPYSGIDNRNLSNLFRVPAGPAS
jgi:hypothetical protein